MRIEVIFNDRVFFSFRGTVDLIYSIILVIIEGKPVDYLDLPR